MVDLGCRRGTAIAIVFVLSFVMMSVSLVSGRADVALQEGRTTTVSAQPLGTDIVTDSTGGVTYRIYDMFAEPWGDWWVLRTPNYGCDYMITSGEQNTMLFLVEEDGEDSQGIIYAPYRMSMSANDFSGVNVNSPVFMPVLGPAEVVGDPSVEMSVYFQYINEDWWDAYWMPVWSVRDDWWVGYPNTILGMHDGYIIGTTYEITMNRPAAERWLGMPQAQDPMTWWSANRENYADDWVAWIDYEANDRLDIYSGFEDRYYDMGTMMELIAVGDDLVLEIGHFSWGYEVLTTRWLSDAGVCNHEPWYEDFQMDMNLEAEHSDIDLDAVCQYSLHAVVSSESEDQPAWVWEANNIDYVPSVLSHPDSDYDPYANLYYTSSNCGDLCFGMPVKYEYTPTCFDLSEGDTLIFELPDEEVIGYLGGSPGVSAYIDLIAGGDPSGFDALRQDGYLHLGSSVTNPDAGIDLLDCYDVANKTLTIEGPVEFDNYRHWPDGPLYHGAPWIEFNVLDSPVSPASVCGVVTDEDSGLPLASAVVSVSGEGAGGPYLIEFPCDDQGYYEAVVPAGEVDVCASASGYLAVCVHLSLAPGEYVTQDFALGQVVTTAFVCGTVTSAVTGLALDGATVTLSGLDGGEPFEIEVTCDDQGYYEAVIPAGEIDVCASASGYLAACVHLSLSPGEHVTQDFALEQVVTTAFVCGTVTSAATGLPLDGAAVTFSGLDGGEPFEIEVTCDDQGYYEATVPAGEVEITASASSHIPQSVTLVLYPGDSVSQDFALEYDDGWVFDVVMVAGKKSGRTVEFEFTPDESGVWYAKIENHGLDALRVVVYEVDAQTGDRETISMQFISFRSHSAPWSGVVYTDSVDVEAGKAYVVEYTPKSDIIGSYCVVYNFVTDSGHPASASSLAGSAGSLVSLGVAVSLAASLALAGLVLRRSRQN